MHTTMVPEQVKTMKIQAGIQVSRPRELRRQLQLWKHFGRLYLIVFVLVRKIIRYEEIRTRISKRAIEMAELADDVLDEGLSLHPDDAGFVELNELRDPITQHEDVIADGDELPFTHLASELADRVCNEFFSRNKHIPTRLNFKEADFDLNITQPPATQGKETDYCDGLRCMLETLYPGIKLASGAIDMFTHVLNDAERSKNKQTTPRLFYHTVVLTSEMLKWEHHKALLKFNENMKLVLGSSQYKRLDAVELVFFPIISGSHFFVICINLKYNRVEYLDNIFSTETNPYARYGFSATQMTYRGEGDRGDRCCLKEEGTGQQGQINELRIKYVANILLADCNKAKSKFEQETHAFKTLPVEEKKRLKAEDPPLPADLKEETLCALLGTHTSALELFLIQRKIKGPSWLSILKFTNCSTAQRIDTPTLASEWTRSGMLSHFTVVRKLEDEHFLLVSYSLIELAKTPLYKNRKEIAPHDIPRLFQSSQTLMELVSNCMYGCLGFSNSRLYAKPLAELITLQGREILQQIVDLVQNNLNLRLADINKAKSIAGSVIREVNKKYKRLEIDLDDLYKRMLLVKKKKYAAVKEQLKDGKIYKTQKNELLNEKLEQQVKHIECAAYLHGSSTCTDIAKVTRKRQKPDKNGHENERVHKSRDFSIK
nr:DNA polymerase alpha catalytic subunit [Tanacetum cinerariifolium]